MQLPLVKPDDHWAIWAVLVGSAATSIWLEQKSPIVRRITGAVVALFAGMALSNFGVLPTASVSYDVMEKYLVPLAIPLLLVKMNVLRVIRETGRLFFVFHLAALGTVVGTFVAVPLLGHRIEDLPEIGAAMSASYIGGAVNLFAMFETFQPAKDIRSATIVADNAVMALYFLVLIALPAIPAVRRAFRPLPERALRPDDGVAAEDFWRGRPVSVLQIGMSLALAFLIATIADKVSAQFREGTHPLVQSSLGQRYLILTVLSVSFPLVFPRAAERLAGSDELGSFLIYVFFVLVGVPASFEVVLDRAPLLFVFCGVILLGNFVVTFVAGKLFGFGVEECVLAAVVTSGGPMNGAAISISKGWSGLVVPSVLAGLWGYCIGNLVGWAVGNVLVGWYG